MKLPRRALPVAVALLVAALAAHTAIARKRYHSGIEWQEPVRVTPSATLGGPPSDAIVLFDGTDMSEWKGAENWKVDGGQAIVGKGSITSKKQFGDCQVHLEWQSPKLTDASGQNYGNSGIDLMGKYEVQILNSYDNQTYFDGMAGAVYLQSAPMVNACRPPGEWNTYDILWTAPRFDDEGKLKSPAYVTVLMNGVLIQDHFEITGSTGGRRMPSYRGAKSKGPIRLQDHRNPVRFRNIWVRETKPAPGKRIHEPKMKEMNNG